MAQVTTRPGAGKSPYHQETRRQPPWGNGWLIQLWRLLVFSSSAAGMAWVLLENSWWLKTPSQVVFHGASQQDHGDLLAASALKFPTPLLAVDPLSIQQGLQHLVSPTLQVQVQRTLTPPQLVVRLQNGTSHAWVRRSMVDRVERGLLDHQFNWASFDPQYQLDRLPTVKNSVLVLVDFWTPGLQGTLAELFSELEHMKTPVSTIRMTSDGQLVLRTSEVLGEVRLGQPDRLSHKLEILDHLYMQLERSTAPFSYTYVDLQNPEEPELGLY